MDTAFSMIAIQLRDLGEIKIRSFSRINLDCTVIYVRSRNNVSTTFSLDRKSVLRSYSRNNGSETARR